MTEPTNLPRTVKRFDGTIDFPRRNCVDQYTPTEQAIAAAVDAVERAGASIALTDAVQLLTKAQSRVADHIEGIPEGSRPATPPTPEPVAWVVLDKNGKWRSDASRSKSILENYAANSDVHPDGPFTVQPLYLGASQPAPPAPTPSTEGRKEVVPHGARAGTSRASGGDTMTGAAHLTNADADRWKADPKVQDALANHIDAKNECESSQHDLSSAARRNKAQTRFFSTLHALCEAVASCVASCVAPQ